MYFFAFAAASLALALTVLASPVLEEKNGKPKIYGYRNGDKCPAKSFYVDCNSCVCSEDGYSAACTRDACPSLQRKFAAHSVKEDHAHNDLFGLTGECRPGMYFVHKCNSCHCANDGRTAGCTDIACPEVEKLHIDGYRSGEACVPGNTFYDWCNSCTCGSNGRSATCIPIAC